jgi:hypothetical protein
VSAYTHALVDGVMFAIDGKDGDLAFARRGGQDFAGGYHAFLVGETDGLTGEDGGVGGFKTGYADDGGDYEVGFGEGGAGYCAFGAVDYLDSGDAGLGETG